jgi:hypothetical protein
MAKSSVRLVSAAVIALTASTLVACGSVNTGSTVKATRSFSAAAPGSADDLAGVCPKTIVWQTGWVPEAEHGPVYQMLGGSYSIDAAHKRVTGELIDGAVDTGVQLQVRAGGPAIGYQSVSATMYLDKSILIGGINTDESIQDSNSQPTVGIVTYDQLSPLMIMWDPKVHPTWTTIADIGKTGNKVLYFDGTTYMSYLTGSGTLKHSQIDGSYDGTPSVFVAQGARPAVQGYATQDPYLYQHDIKQYMRPVKYQLVNDLGYSIYPDEVSVRAADLTGRASCLKRLVPVIQRAAVAFYGNPTRTEDLIVKLSSQYNIGSLQSPGLVRYGTTTQKSIGMLANGPHGVMGEFDLSRVAHLIEVDRPIFAAAHKPIRPGLAATQVVNSEFIDSTIGLK